MAFEWSKGQTDKMLLVILFVAGAALVIHGIHHAPVDEALVTWAENTCSTILGALLLLITGKAMAGKGDNGNGAPPVPPAPPAPPQAT